MSASTITHLLSKIGGGDMTRGVLVVSGIGAATGAAATKGYEAIKKSLTKPKK